jgi:hypothetical protein
MASILRNTMRFPHNSSLVPLEFGPARVSLLPTARSSHSRDWVVCTIDTNGLRSPEDRGRFLHTLCLCSVLARVGEAATSSRTSHGFFTQSNPRSPRIITSGRRDLVRPRVAGWSHSGEPQARSFRLAILTFQNGLILVPRAPSCLTATFIHPISWPTD